MTDDTTEDKQSTRTEAGEPDEYISSVTEGREDGGEPVIRLGRWGTQYRIFRTDEEYEVGSGPVGDKYDLVSARQELVAYAIWIVREDEYFGDVTCCQEDIDCWNENPSDLPAGIEIRGTSILRNEDLIEDELYPWGDSPSPDEDISSGSAEHDGHPDSLRFGLHRFGDVFRVIQFGYGEDGLSPGEQDFETSWEGTALGTTALRDARAAFVDVGIDVIPSIGAYNFSCSKADFDAWCEVNGCKGKSKAALAKRDEELHRRKVQWDGELTPWPSKERNPGDGDDDW